MTEPCWTAPLTPRLTATQPRVPAPVAIVLLLLAPPTGQGQENNLVVRSATNPAQEALVGQRIRLTIDVLARDAWANLPGQERIDVPGAFVVAPPNASVRLTEQIDGGTFTGQRYEFWIYPQRAGQLQIPSLEWKVELKPLAFGKASTTQAAETEAMSIQVNYPTGVKPSSGLICTSNLTVKQDWQPADESLVAGDGITRTITRVVEGVPAMALTPLPADEIPGVGVYVKQPQINDRFDRGSLTGTRVDSVTYVFQDAGTVNLTEIRFPWWDLESKQLTAEVLRGRTIEVQPVAASESTSQQASRSRDGRNGVIWITLFVSAAGLVVLVYHRPLLDQIQRWQAARESSESFLFQQFVSTARRGQPLATLQALTRWWDVADDQDPAPRLDRFLQEYGTPEALLKLRELQQAVDQRQDSWQAHTFVRQIRSARDRYQAARSRRGGDDRRALPPLNPSDWSPSHYASRLF